MLKKKSKFLLVVFLIVSILMVSMAAYWYFHAKGLVILFSSLVFDWCLLVLTSVLFLLVDIQLPTRYYKTERWKSEIELYKKIGILTFRNFIRRGLIHKLAPQIEISGQNRSFDELLKDMRQAETIHVFTFLTTLIICIISVWTDKVFNGLFLMLFNLLFHIYPIMLQRFNRKRINNIIVKGFDNKIND